MRGIPDDGPGSLGAYNNSINSVSLCLIYTSEVRYWQTFDGAKFPRFDVVMLDGVDDIFTDVSVDSVQRI